MENVSCLNMCISQDIVNIKISLHQILFKLKCCSGFWTSYTIASIWKYLNWNHNNDFISNYQAEKDSVSLYICQQKNASFKKIKTYSMQGWTATMRHGATRKKKAQKSVSKKPRVKKCILILDLKRLRSKVKGWHSVGEFKSLAVRGKRLLT